MCSMQAATAEQWSRSSVPAKPWWLSAAGSLRLIGYNPLIAQGDRLASICDGLRQASVICLAGTKRRAGRYKENAAVVERGGSWLHCDFGYRLKQQHHAGVSISFKCYGAAEPPIKELYTAETKPLLQGRFGAVRVKSKACDVVFVSLYLPPFSSILNKKIHEELLLFLDGFLSKLPARTLPLIACDANCRLGFQKVQGEWLLEQSKSVGCAEPDYETPPGLRFRLLLQKHHLAAINTFYSAGCTYYNGRTSSRIDYVVGPISLLQHNRVDACEVLLEANKYVQAKPSRFPRDHVPLQVKLRLALAYEKAQPRADSLWWDRDALLLACQGKGSHDVFQAELVEYFSLKQDEVNEAVESGWAQALRWPAGSGVH
eukprot:TRINITY_DN17270_c0_g1_i1.p1 TRINITY_DN17270_c0_g1~~TRINITY_DN17270_c0_g1_i1.p1  ORF type:complete len:373 (-),score=98.15 TRINITY_DN17270_c0_g1_i1:437-1555(-)